MSASVGRHERVEAFLLRAGHHPSADRRVRGDGKAAVSGPNADQEAGTAGDDAAANATTKSDRTTRSRIIR
jgi:hypothetical protein